MDRRIATNLSKVINVSDTIFFPLSLAYFLFGLIGWFKVVLKSPISGCLFIYLFIYLV